LSAVPTNDHTVPQKYLRRFAELRSGKGYYTTAAAPVDDLPRKFTPSLNKVGAVKGFYWTTKPDGTDHHEMEALLQRIEDAAIPAFQAMLDDKEGALPRTWPMSLDRRVCMAWWVAAQILRTTRQRSRLERLAGAEPLDAPPEVGRFAKNHTHIAYIAKQLAGLARIIFEKPWCIGFSDVCLLTSDVPVVILNSHDHPDQAFAAWYDEVYLPLDPHRFLLMPGQHLQEEDPLKRMDHREKLDGGLGTFFNDVIWAAADRQVFYHPEHDPIPMLVDRSHQGPRLPSPGTADENSPPMYAISYGVLPPNMTVERRWLSEHPPPRATGDGAEDNS
jgi:hypothetical protein